MQKKENERKPVHCLFFLSLFSGSIFDYFSFLQIALFHAFHFFTSLLFEFFILLRYFIPFFIKNSEELSKWSGKGRQLLRYTGKHLNLKDVKKKWTKNKEQSRTRENVKTCQFGSCETIDQSHFTLTSSYSHSLHNSLFFLVFFGVFVVVSTKNPFGSNCMFDF